MKCGSLVISVAVLLAASQAHASTDINGLFDARSHAMGATGAAYLDSAGAIPTNPALLDQIGKLTISLDLFLIGSQPEAPYTIYHPYPNGQHFADWESIRSPLVFAPLPFVGAAYRLTDRIVLGLAAYPEIGQGTSATYRPAPEEFPNVVAVNKAALGLIEASEALSVRVLDNLSVAAAWRVTYMTQSVSTPLATNAPPAGVLIDGNDNPVNANIKVTGLNLTGFQLGVLYKPLPNFRIGLTYRSRVTVNGTGTTTTQIGASPTIVDTKQSYTNPQSLRAGLAWSVLDDKLLLATDFKYLLYAQAFKVLHTTTIMDGVSSTNSTPVYWKNSYSVHLGTEYKLTDTWRARLGYILVKSATNPTYALDFFAPPGYSHCVTGGLGVLASDHFNVDLAGAYVVLASDINVATKYNAGIGHYSAHGAEFSLSATYHM